MSLELVSYSLTLGDAELNGGVSSALSLVMVGCDTEEFSVAGADTERGGVKEPWAGDDVSNALPVAWITHSKMSLEFRTFGLEIAMKTSRLCQRVRKILRRWRYHQQAA
jgi:hypothetical protein